jgi:hypothetical protein
MISSPFDFIWHLSSRRLHWVSRVLANRRTQKTCRELLTGPLALDVSENALASSRRSKPAQSRLSTLSIFLLLTPLSAVSVVFL